MKKLFINMAVGDFFGWAICGRNLVRELERKTPIAYIPDGYESVPKDKAVEKFLEGITESPNGKPFNYLQSISNDDMTCRHKGDISIGYMFYEEETLPAEKVDQLRGYDKIATGSHWNTRVLHNHGLDSAFTVHQGVDCGVFKPAERRMLKDKFVVFSGGKFEYRKAQDVVINAVNILQEKYPDMVLMTSWTNLFLPDENYLDEVKKHLDPERTYMLPLLSNKELPQYLAQSDIGVFPNRCEAGTNLVMMEYMACGKPVVANAGTGQGDVLDNSYAFTYKADEEHLLDATVARLEEAYHRRAEFPAMGEKAREAMQAFTWEKAAEGFVRAYES